MNHSFIPVLSRRCLPFLAAAFLAVSAGCGGGGSSTVVVTPPANNGGTGNNNQTTGATVTGTVDTGGTVAARGASSVQDVSTLTATLYTVGTGGALTAVSGVASVPVTVDPANPSQGTFQFTKVPETVINGVVQLKDNTSGSTLEAILPGVDKDETNAVAVDVKTHQEAAVLKEVVKQNLLTAEKVDPAIIKETLTSDMLTQGFNPADMAQGVKAASEEVFNNLKAELGSATDDAAIQQIKDIRRHQVDTIRIREELAKGDDSKKANLEAQLATAQTKFENELKTKLPPKAGEDKLAIEKFQEFQQAGTAQLAANVTNAELKDRIEERHEVSEVVHALLSMARFLFPDAAEAGAPVSPVEVIARVTGLSTAEVKAEFKTLVDEAQKKSADPLTDQAALIQNIIARAKLLRNKILTADNLMALSDIESVEAALQTLEGQIHDKFAANTDPKEVDTFARTRLKEILTALDAKLDARLADLPETARKAVKEAVRQVLVTLSTGRIPPHLVRDPAAPLPPAATVAAPEDTDADGVPNFIEIKEGSDPNSAGSKPQPVVLVMPGDGVDNDKDGKTDDEKGGFNGIDDDGDGKVDEDVTSDIALTTFAGTISFQGAPLGGVTLVLAFSPPGPDMKIAYHADAATDATGTFSFSSVKAGRYFLAGYLEVDGIAGLGKDDKVGFYGTSAGPVPVEITAGGLKLNITDEWIVAVPGARGKFTGKLVGPSGVAQRGKVTACRLDITAAGTTATPNTTDAAAPQMCIPGFETAADGTFTLEVEAGVWLVKIFFATTNDTCFMEGKVTVVKDTTVSVVLGAPVCQGTIPTGQAGSLEGVLEPLIKTVNDLSPSATTTATHVPTVGLFLNPPGPGAPVFILADGPVDATGHFKFSKVPLNQVSFLAVWREGNGVVGPQAEESMAILVGSDGKPKVISLTAPTLLNLGNIISAMLKPIAAPKVLKGVVKNIATGRGVPAEVSFCPLAATDALAPLESGVVNTTTTTNTTSGGATQPAVPCFFIKTSLEGLFTMDIPPGVFTAHAKGGDAGFTSPYKLEVFEDKIRFGPYTDSPTLTVVPTLSLTLTSQDIPLVVVQ